MASILVVGLLLLLPVEISSIGHQRGMVYRFPPWPRIVFRRLSLPVKGAHHVIPNWKVFVIKPVPVRDRSRVVPVQPHTVTVPYVPNTRPPCVALIDTILGSSRLRFVLPFQPTSVIGVPLQYKLLGMTFASQPGISYEEQSKYFLNFILAHQRLRTSMFKYLEKMAVHQLHTLNSNIGQGRFIMKNVRFVTAQDITNRQGFQSSMASGYPGRRLPLHSSGGVTQKRHSYTKHYHVNSVLYRRQGTHSELKSDLPHKPRNTPEYQHGLHLQNSPIAYDHAKGISNSITQRAFGMNGQRRNTLNTINFMTPKKVPLNANSGFSNPSMLTVSSQHALTSMVGSSNPFMPRHSFKSSNQLATNTKVSSPYRGMSNGTLRKTQYQVLPSESSGNPAYSVSVLSNILKPSRQKVIETNNEYPYQHTVLNKNNWFRNPSALSKNVLAFSKQLTNNGSQVISTLPNNILASRNGPTMDLNNRSLRPSKLTNNILQLHNQGAFSTNILPPNPSLSNSILNSPNQPALNKDVEFQNPSVLQSIWGSPDKSAFSVNNGHPNPSMSHSNVATSLSQPSLRPNTRPPVPSTVSSIPLNSTNSNRRMTLHAQRIFNSNSVLTNPFILNNNIMHSAHQHEFSINKTQSMSNSNNIDVSRQPALSSNIGSQNPFMQNMILTSPKQLSMHAINSILTLVGQQRMPTNGQFSTPSISKQIVISPIQPVLNKNAESLNNPMSGSSIIRPFSQLGLNMRRSLNFSIPINIPMLLSQSVIKTNVKPLNPSMLRNNMVATSMQTGVDTINEVSKPSASNSIVRSPSQLVSPNVSGGNSIQTPPNQPVLNSNVAFSNPYLSSADFVPSSNQQRSNFDISYTFPESVNQLAVNSPNQPVYSTNAHFLNPSLSSIVTSFNQSGLKRENGGNNLLNNMLGNSNQRASTNVSVENNMLTSLKEQNVKSFNYLTSINNGFIPFNHPVHNSNSRAGIPIFSTNGAFQNTSMLNALSTTAWPAMENILVRLLSTLRKSNNISSDMQNILQTKLLSNSVVPNNSNRLAKQSSRGISDRLRNILLSKRQSLLISILRAMNPSISSKRDSILKNRNSRQFTDTEMNSNGNVAGRNSASRQRVLTAFHNEPGTPTKVDTGYVGQPAAGFRQSSSAGFAGIQPYSSQTPENIYSAAGQSFKKMSTLTEKLSGSSTMDNIATDIGKQNRVSLKSLFSNSAGNKANMTKLSSWPLFSNANQIPNSTIPGIKGQRLLPAGVSDVPSSLKTLVKNTNTRLNNQSTNIVNKVKSSALDAVNVVSVNLPSVVKRKSASSQQKKQLNSVTFSTIRGDFIIHMDGKGNVVRFEPVKGKNRFNTNTNRLPAVSSSQVKSNYTSATIFAPNNSVPRSTASTNIKLSLPSTGPQRDSIRQHNHVIPSAATLLRDPRWSRVPISGSGQTHPASVHQSSGSSTYTPDVPQSLMMPLSLVRADNQAAQRHQGSQKTYTPSGKPISNRPASARAPGTSGREDVRPTTLNVYLSYPDLQRRKIDTTQVGSGNRHVTNAHGGSKFSSANLEVTTDGHHSTPNMFNSQPSTLVSNHQTASVDNMSNQGKAASDNLKAGSIENRSISSKLDVILHKLRRLLSQSLDNGKPNDLMSKYKQGTLLTDGPSFSQILGLSGQNLETFTTTVPYVRDAQTSALHIQRHSMQPVSPITTGIEAVPNDGHSQDMTPQIQGAPLRNVLSLTANSDLFIAKPNSVNGLGESSSNGILNDLKRSPAGDLLVLLDINGNIKRVNSVSLNNGVNQNVKSLASLLGDSAVVGSGTGQPPGGHAALPHTSHLAVQTSPSNALLKTPAVGQRNTDSVSVSSAASSHGERSLTTASPPRQTAGTSSSGSVVLSSSTIKPLSIQDIASSVSHAVIAHLDGLTKVSSTSPKRAYSGNELPSTFSNSFQLGNTGWSARDIAYMKMADMDIPPFAPWSTHKDRSRTSVLSTGPTSGQRRWSAKEIAFMNMIDMDIPPIAGMAMID